MGSRRGCGGGTAGRGLEGVGEVDGYGVVAQQLAVDAALAGGDLFGEGGGPGADQVGGVALRWLAHREDRDQQGGEADRQAQQAGGVLRFESAPGQLHHGVEQARCDHGCADPAGSFPHPPMLTAPDRHAPDDGPDLRHCAAVSRGHAAPGVPGAPGGGRRPCSGGCAPGGRVGQVVDGGLLGQDVSLAFHEPADVDVQVHSGHPGGLHSSAAPSRGTTSPQSGTLAPSAASARSSPLT